MAQSLGQLAPGTKCDRYDIIRLIGAGGMGEVYQAMHEFTKKQVALKVLKVAHATKVHHVEKMRAEAMVLCRIRHPNLVEVYDAGFADVQTSHGPQSLIWMAMELLEGESLRERLMREGAVRPALALEWTAQVASGTQAAHEARILHRDLKPENIFITKKGDIRVLDFGTATFEGFDRPQTHSDRMGTIPYMSPEHIGGEALDPRTDVYALGFILYEMLAGRHPFSDANGGFPPLDRLLPMALAAEPDSLERHVGATVWHVVALAVGKDRARRFGSMAEMAAAARRAAGAYGTDASGVALRLSGGSSALAESAQSQIGNVTPPPLAAGIARAPSTSGVTGGAIVTMALLAAAVGAGAVVLVSRPGFEPVKDDTHVAADGSATKDERPASSPASSPATSPATSPAPAPSEAPSASVAAPNPVPPNPLPIGPRPPGRRAAPPPTPPQPPKLPCPRSDEIIPKPCN